MRLFLAAIFVVAGMGSAVAWESHWVGREGAMRHHIGTAGADATWIVGDSLTEGFWWNQIGNCRVINVGFGGITAKAMAGRIGGLSGYGTPRYAIVMIGTNTANVAIPQSEVDAFPTHLRTIVDALVARGARPLLASIPPIEANVGAGPQFSQARINQMNNAIVALAAERGYPLINLNYPFMDLQQFVAYPGTTTDGVHLTPASYGKLYNAFNAALSARVASAGVPCI